MAEEETGTHRPTPPAEVKIPDPQPVSSDIQQSQAGMEQGGQGMVMENATDQKNN